MFFYLFKTTIKFNIVTFVLKILGYYCNHEQLFPTDRMY